MIPDLSPAILPGAAITAGVALLLLFGRDPKGADEHTVDDYRPEPEEVARAEERGWHRGFDTARRYPRRLRPVAEDILPPAPPGTTAGCPLYAEQVVAEVMRERYGTTDHAEIARRFLREIADDEMAEVGLDPSGHAWGFDGSCWADCPGCARDMTGAFPVVAVAA